MIDRHHICVGAHPKLCACVQAALLALPVSLNWNALLLEKAVTAVFFIALHDVTANSVIENV